MNTRLWGTNMGTDIKRGAQGDSGLTSYNVGMEALKR